MNETNTTKQENQMAKVTVKYWIGTTRFEGKASTYNGAMRLASKNQNAYPPTFYDAEGNELFDDGHGLCDPEKSVSLPQPNGSVIERRNYIV